MNIVVDANITLALFVRLPYSEPAEAAFRRWRSQGDQLFAPGLWQVEIVSSLCKISTMDQLTADDARLVLANLDNLQVEVVYPDAVLLEASLKWAERIGQPVAYDSQYLALAQAVQAEFWSADRRLVAALQAMDIPWAHCIR